MRIGRLSIGLFRTSEMHCTRFIIASWAYETGYWRWCLDWLPPKSWRDALCLPRISPSWASGTRWFASKSWTSIACGVRLPLVGGFALHTQPPFEAMKYSATADRRAQA